MNIAFDEKITGLPEAGLALEWLETNGLGGWASSTVAGCHTRRYHGLLCAATLPPVGRMVLLSKLDETLHLDGKTLELGCNDYGTAFHPQGFQYLTSFKKDLFPEFLYEASGIRLRKKIVAVHGENTVLVLYEVLQAPAGFEISFLPLLAFRDFHSHAHANAQVNAGFEFSEGQLHLKPYPDAPDLYISLPEADFVSQPDWYYNFHHRAEQERGLDFTEDLFTPGTLRRKATAGQTFGIIISTEPQADRDVFKLLDAETQRRQTLHKNIPKKDFVQQILVLAADQFIVRRGQDLKTIIAGYPWFSDWGRDTMIAITGLCTWNDRPDDARKILKAFDGAISRGMLPNRFSDNGEDVEYNTADATLWYFVGIYHFWKKTGEDDFVKNELLGGLKDILAWHYRGTRYGIHADTDGLLMAGEPGVQLTWMDAKVGDWVVTPRQGKAVEINALWYNAHCIYAELNRHFGNDQAATDAHEQAAIIRQAFESTFWNEDKNCLYDYVDSGFKNDDIRPNQVFAISLPFALATGKKAESILQVIENQLLTPVGLRSLSPQHPDYKPHYGGNQWQRDGAYHQGTVWSWLLGPYIDALITCRGKAGREQAKQLLKNFEFHYRQAGLGTVSEIFEGEAPHLPCGCFAQAWSVGELLRVYRQYQLSS